MVSDFPLSHEFSSTLHSKKKKKDTKCLLQIKSVAEIICVIYLTAPATCIGAIPQSLWQMTHCLESSNTAHIYAVYHLAANGKYLIPVALTLKAP